MDPALETLCSKADRVLETALRHPLPHPAALTPTALDLLRPGLDLRIWTGSEGRAGRGAPGRGGIGAGGWAGVAHLGSREGALMGEFPCPWAVCDSHMTKHLSLLFSAQGSEFLPIEVIIYSWENKHLSLFCCDY